MIPRLALCPVAKDFFFVLEDRNTVALYLNAKFKCALATVYFRTIKFLKKVRKILSFSLIKKSSLLAVE